MTLAEDQVWQVDGAYAHIVTVGKRLVHYKMAKSLIGHAAKVVPIRVGKREEVQAYLAVHGAVLVNLRGQSTPEETRKPPKQKSEL